MCPRCSHCPWNFFTILVCTPGPGGTVELLELWIGSQIMFSQRTSGVCWPPLTLWAPCGASFLCRDGNWQGRMAARSPRHLCWQWWWPWGRQGDRHPQCLRCSQAPRLWMSPSIYHSGSSSGELTLCPVLKFLFIHPSCITELARPCFLSPGYSSLHLIWFYSLE